MVIVYTLVRLSVILLTALILTVSFAFPSFAQRNLAVIPTEASVQHAPFLGIEKRVALVIGNNAYATAPLSAPINDARAMAKVLKELGFEVIEIEDVGRVPMARAIATFIDKLNEVDAIGLFYYAGHGAQSDGKNFLIPIDADIQQEADIEIQGINLQYMLDKFADRRNGLNILILDACRNNPFTRRSGKHASGLTAVDGPPGTLIAFAAAPGQVASEIQGGNGIYTKHILNNIGKPGIPVEEVFKRIRYGVLTETGQRQVPWENTSLVRDFYFRAAPVGSGYRPIAEDIESEAWAKIESSRNIYDFTGFMRQFPKSRYQSEILVRINSILAKLKPVPPAIMASDLPIFLSESYAGFMMRALNKYSAEHYGLKSEEGALITDVERVSPAARYGLQPGDVLLEINGAPIKSINDVMAYGRTILPGEYVEGVVWRNKMKNAVSGVTTRAPLERLLERIATELLNRKEYERARHFYEYLAQTNDAAGQFGLGTMYLTGHGVARNYNEAEIWLSKSAMQGKAYAAAYLASIYLYPGSGIKNDASAYKWAKFSADAGVPEGIVMLAVANYDGIGTTRNLVEAVRLARIAAEQGQAAGMFLLGAAYERGVGGLSHSLNDAKLWYGRARSLGHVPAKAALQRLGD